ncbi:MAG: ADP-ribose pyrophosphatase, partial [Candidatus Melainabacteria bacterium HGW-Melainabacteria-1]
MGGYILELRQLLGSRPLIICGATTLVFDQNQAVLLQR